MKNKFLQFLSSMRRGAAMLLLLLTCVTHAWAYTIIRNGDLYGSGGWSNSETMTQVGSTNVYYKTYNSPTATTDLIFRIGTGSEWETAQGDAGIDNKNSNIVMVATGSDSNIKFQVPTSVPVTIYYNSSTKKIWIKVDSYKTDVLNGKEMFYYGFTKNWSGDFAHFYDNGTRKFGSWAATSYADGSAKLAIGVYDVSSSTNYSASNSDSWAGTSHSGMAAGCQIQSYESGGNHYCYYNAASTFSFGSTAYTIVVGQTIASFPSISFTSKTSGVGSSLSLENYYYSTATSGQTWNVFTPGTTESSLAAGTYYIKAIATDGAIYMASTNYITLTVNSAPVLGVANATSVTSSSATFNGTVTLNSNTTSSYGFKYGAGASYDTKAELISGGTSASTTGALDGTTFSKEVTGLSASTTYYYISYAVVNGTTYYSDAVKSFTTSAAATYNLSVVAGTGISAVTGSTNNISANQSIAITATVATGYTWSTWTKTGAGTLSTFTAGTKDQTVKVGAVGNMTLTASATENMSSLTTSNTYDAGNPSYAIPTKSASYIGISTTATLTATTPSTGYTFAGWTLSDNLVVTGGDKDNDLSITVRTNGNGAEATAQANYNEVLTSTYYLVGNNLAVFPGDATWAASDSKNMLRKASGSSTGSVGSITINVKFIPANSSDYQFKIHESSANKWWGWSNEYYYKMNATKTTSLYDNQHNLYFIPNALGDYTFTTDWSDENEPSLTVTFPATTYTVNFGQGAGTAGSASATYSSTSFSSGTKVQDGKSITLTAPSASSGYTWDGWYNASSGGTRVSTSNPLTTTVSSTNYNFYARYTENQYNETVSVSPAGYGTTTPSAGTVAIKQVTGTSITANPGDDYAFVNWTYSDGGITASDATNKTCTFKATSTGGTITANFTNRFYLKGSAEMGAWSTENEMPITVTANTYSVTLSLAAKTTYDFKVFNRHTGAAIGASSTTLTRGTNSKTGLTTAGGDTYNIHVTTDAAGNYTFKYLYNASEGSMKITVDYPEAYTVTYGAGTINGSNSAISVSPSFTSGDYVLPETNITFSKGSTKAGYTWKGWYSNVGGTGDAWSTTDASLSLTDTRDGNISVYACYNFITYSITYNLNGGSNPVSPAPASSFNVETSTITLPTPTRTGYTFNGWYANSDLSTGGVKTQIAKGTHEDQEFWAKWTANEYTITLKPNGGSGDDQSVTATFDDHAPDYDEGAKNYKFASITNPTKTGYNFEGWWTSSDAGTTLVTEIITKYKFYEWNTSYVNNSGLWQHDGNVTVYAKWTPKNYAVTLSTTGETGYGSNAPANQTATYGADMPAITLPVGAPGYKFQGYFTAANGAGIQYYNADGTSAHTWDIASATTLHAHFQKTVISTLEHPASIAKGDVVTLDVNPVFNQTGATDYMDICWSLLYDNDNPVESGVAIERYATLEKPNQVRFTLTGLSAGYYKVKAVLKANASSFVACDAGTELSTFKSNLRIAGNSNVTILYQDASGNTIHENGSVEVARGETVGVKAPTIVGYTFSSWTLGDVLSNECASSASCGTDKDSINISAEYDGILIAKYNRKNTIYFKNTLNWPAVYVNLLSGSYWSSTDGSGNNGQTYKNYAMTQLGTSDVWYYEYGATSTSDYISFTSASQNGIEKFYGDETEVENDRVNVVYPTRPNYEGSEQTAYGFNVNTPMFVPLAGQTANKMTVTSKGVAYYYNKGYWAKYEPVSKETGYILKIYNKKNSSDLPDKDQAPVEIKSIPFTFSGDMTFPVHITTDLETSKTYGFKIYRDKGNTGDANSWYGNNNTMSNGHSGELGTTQGKWEFKTGTSNCGLLTAGSGDYTFTLTYDLDEGGSDYNYLVGVHYPEASGDYRVVFSDGVRSGILSHVIPKDAETDTISFFIDDTRTNVLKLQKCSVVYDPDADGGRGATTITWTDTVANLFTGGVLPAAITKKGVYYFCINRNADGKKELGDTKLYEGNFYIRTDGATPSKWDNFRQNNHLMAYSEYADKHENFTHSYTQWYDLTNRKNLKFTVANDYSVSISDTLVREALEGQWAHINDYIDEKGDLNREANVRFMYNQKTNAISRAYIDGAYSAGTNFLVIESGDSKISIRNHNNTADSVISVLKFSDNGNWIYEANVKAQPGATYKLRSVYGTTGGDKHEITQYFKGGASSTETLIGGSGSSWYQIRLLYDFKTNRVVTAYQPSGNINEDLEIHADIMFMREHQGDINEITFASGKKITDIENIYCGLRFNKWTLNNKSKEEGHATLSPLLSRYERDIFYVSFPYDVKLSDAIGFGTYGTHWIVEYYDGAARAKNGFWIDSDSYWKFVTPSMKDTFTLRAGTGYIVALDLDELYYIDKSHHASIWNNTDISDLEILFPGKVSSISDIDVTYNMPTHQCTINRGTTAGDRRIKDSHWNVLGVPTFKNITGAASADGGGSGEIRFANVALLDTLVNDLKFIYDGNLADNSLTPKAVKDFEFKAMHAYVVQYCGDVTFTTSATPAPASVAARTYAEEPIDVDFRLELNKDGVLEDQTFVSLSNDENASADFRFGEDLSKEFNNNRANIYTFIGTEWVAGNTLPMTNQTTIVPVGVKIAADGEYTFSIPEGTYGVGITLIDNEAGARVNLGLMDYTVTLAAGQIDDRFVLEISPISQSPTGVELLNGENGENGVRKVLIDNILYIVKDGVVYDAQGKRLQ